VTSIVHREAEVRRRARNTSELRPPLSMSSGADHVPFVKVSASAGSNAEQKLADAHETARIWESSTFDVAQFTPLKV